MSNFADEMREAAGAQCKIGPLQFDGFVRGAQAALRSQLVRDMATALKSIASEHKPSHAEEEYWTEKRSHEECATVLATDTKIARDALAAYAKEVEGER